MFTIHLNILCYKYKIFVDTNTRVFFPPSMTHFWWLFRPCGLLMELICPTTMTELSFYYLFFHRRPIDKLCFVPCRPFVDNATFSTGLVENTCEWDDGEKIGNKNK